MSSHSRPTCGIWRKWSITHREVKPASSAARATAASARAGLPLPAEAGDLQPELERQRRLGLARGGGGRVEEAGRHELDGPRGVDAREALVAERREHRGRLAQLRGDDLRRHRRAARAVALAHDLLRGVEHDRVGRHARRLRQLAPRRAALGLQPGRVDHGGQPAGEALRHDQVEQLERVAARTLVALAAPDDRAQAVGGDDLVGLEPRARPVRLPRRRRADEHDEARIRQPHS